MPVRIVARPADAQRGDAQNAMPVYFVDEPPVTGHRANPEKAIPIWLAPGPPTDPQRRDRANAANAAPVYIPSTPLPPPVSAAPPAISGTGIVGNALSCTQGAWDNEPSSFAYQWRRSGNPITGATASAYTLVSADAGASITCEVTATNASGSASRASNSITVQGAPVNVIKPTVNGTGVVGESVWTTAGSWTNAPTAYYYGWRRDGASISDATENTYTLVEADRGAAISSIVLGVNAAGSGVAVASSNSIVVG